MIYDLTMVLKIINRSGGPRVVTGHIGHPGIWFRAPSENPCY